MKFALMTVGSAALSSVLVGAVPLSTRQDDTVFIDLRTGDGDATSGFSIAANQLVSTANLVQSAQKGVSAEAVTTGFFCQAYSDAAGTKELGGVFTSTTSASFTDASDGSVGSTADEAVPVAAFCCVESKLRFPILCKPTSTSTSSASKPTYSSASSASSSTANQVRIQLSGMDDSAAQGEVADDGSLVILKDKGPFYSYVQSGFITDVGTATNPTCQAYSDDQGNVPIGKPFGTSSVYFNDGKEAEVLSVRCKSN
ncbi:hypothetical protein B7463_g11124, partial [Scytalidium lignicola]